MALVCTVHSIQGQLCKFRRPAQTKSTPSADILKSALGKRQGRDGFEPVPAFQSHKSVRPRCRRKALSERRQCYKAWVSALRAAQTC